METWLVPGAHLELAPVFLLAALGVAAGLRRAARRRPPAPDLPAD